MKCTNPAYVSVEMGTVVLMANIPVQDDEPFRRTFVVGAFPTRKALHDFIDKLRVAEMEAFGVYPSEDKETGHGS